MIIRKAQISDLSLLYALERELFSDANYPLSRGSLAYHIKSNMLYVAQIDGNIAGYVLVLIKRKKAKLYSIGVGRDHRNKKISEMLLKRAISELALLGFGTLLLEVRTDNKAAIGLYKKIGFNEIKMLKAFYKDGCDAHLMELKYANETL